MTNVATLSGTEEPVEEVVRKLAEDARVASHALGVSGPIARDEALQNGAAEIRRCTADILAANEKDMAFGREKGLSAAMLDRLLLTEERIEAMAVG